MVQEEDFEYLRLENLEAEAKSFIRDLGSTGFETSTLEQIEEESNPFEVVQESTQQNRREQRI